MEYRQMSELYTQYFSLGNIAADIKQKFALISLICYIVKDLQRKRPDVTFYQIVNKLCTGTGYTEDEIKGLAIVCESFAYGCVDFPTFNIKPADMAKTIKAILNKRLPF